MLPISASPHGNGRQGMQEMEEGSMDRLNSIIDSINAFAWGPPMLGILGVTDVLLTLGLVFMPWCRVGYGFRLLFDKEIVGKGEVKPFNTLMTALSVTVGTGSTLPPPRSCVAMPRPSAPRTASRSCRRPVATWARTEPRLAPGWNTAPSARHASWCPRPGCDCLDSASAGAYESLRSRRGEAHPPLACAGPSRLSVMELAE